MTDLPKRHPLLPDRASPIERAVSKTEGRLDDISYSQVRRVRSVEDATGDELDHLAAERSVDVYDRAWPEEIRRAVVAGWPLVQATIGTPFAIETALSAMRITAELTEWWETSPRGVPYSFQVQALVGAELYADAPVLDLRTLSAVYATVMRTKAHSRPFSMWIGVRMQAELGLAPVAVARPRVDTEALAVLPTPPAETDLGLAPVAVVRPRVSVAAPAVLPVPDAAAELSIVAVAVVRPRLSLLAIAELPA